MKKQNNKYSKGFTLLELLVVIIIIGLLAAIIMASVNSARAKGRDTKRITEMKSMVDALAIYYSANGSYPKTCNSGSCVLVPTYISKFPDNMSYFGLNTLGSACGAYHLGVTLEANNRVLDTDKDMTSNTAGLTAGNYNNCGNTPVASFTIRGAGDTQSCKATDIGSKCYDLVQ